MWDVQLVQGLMSSCCSFASQGRRLTRATRKNADKSGNWLLWQIITHHFNTVLKLISSWQIGVFQDETTTVTGGQES